MNNKLNDKLNDKIDDKIDDIEDIKISNKIITNIKLIPFLYVMENVINVLKKFVIKKICN